MVSTFTVWYVIPCLDCIHVYARCLVAIGPGNDGGAVAVLMVLVLMVMVLMVMVLMYVAGAEAGHHVIDI